MKKLILLVFLNLLPTIVLFASNVTLISSDKNEFIIPIETAHKMTTIRHLIEDTGGEKKIILPQSTTPADALRIIIKLVSIPDDEYFADNSKRIDQITEQITGVKTGIEIGKKKLEKFYNKIAQQEKKLSERNTLIEKKNRLKRERTQLETEVENASSSHAEIAEKKIQNITIEINHITDKINEIKPNYKNDIKAEINRVKWDIFNTEGQLKELKNNEDSFKSELLRLKDKRGLKAREKKAIIEELEKVDFLLLCSVIIGNNYLDALDSYEFESIAMPLLQNIFFDQNKNGELLKELNLFPNIDIKYVENHVIENAFRVFSRLLNKRLARKLIYKIFPVRARPNGFGSSLPSNELTGAAHFKNIIIVSSHLGVSVSEDKGKTWTTKTTYDGLGSNKVNDVHIDRNGIIYAATDQGLSISIDGGEIFNNITSAQGLACDRVFSVFVGNQGHIYAGTEKGLSVSRDGGRHFKIKTKAHGLNDIAIDRVVGDGKNLICTLSRGKLALSNDQGESFKAIFGIADVVNEIFIDHEGIIYAATSKGLVSSNNGGKSFKTLPCRLGLEEDSCSIEYVLKDRLGTMYVVDGFDRLAVSTDGGKSFTFLCFMDNPCFVRRLGIGSHETVYALGSCHNGLYLLENRGKNIENIRAPHSLKTNKIFKLYVGVTNDLYAIPQESNGFSFSADGGINFKNLSFDLASNNVLSIHDQPGYIYLGTNNGLTIIDFKKERPFTVTFGEDPNANSVISIANLKDTIFIGTERGLFISRDEKFKNIENPNELKSAKITSIHVDKSGIIYVGTKDEGLFISTDDGKTFKTLEIAGEYQRNVDDISSIYVDDRGIIYAASQWQGLFMSKDRKNFNLILPSNQGKIRIKQLFKDLQGSIYAVTNKGLLLSCDNGQSFTPFTIADGLLDSKVWSVAGDSLGKVYIATSGGISVIKQPKF